MLTYCIIQLYIGLNRGTWRRNFKVAAAVIHLCTITNIDSQCCAVFRPINPALCLNISLSVDFYNRRSFTVISRSQIFNTDCIGVWIIFGRKLAFRKFLKITVSTGFIRNSTPRRCRNDCDLLFPNNRVPDLSLHGKAAARRTAWNQQLAFTKGNAAVVFFNAPDDIIGRFRPGKNRRSRIGKGRRSALRCKQNLFFA